MAKQDVTVELYYSGAWHDVTSDVYVRDGITVGRGLAEESQEPEPGRASLTFDNRDGAYNPNNPASALYGLVGRNTPLRVSVDGDVRLSGEVADWQPRRAIKGDAWTQASGAGILRRLGKGQKPLKSAIYRAVTAAGPVAYWPLDEGASATQAGSGLSTGLPLTSTNLPTFGAISTPVLAGAVGSYLQMIESHAYTGSGTAALSGLGSSEWSVQAWVHIKADDGAASTAEVTLARWWTNSGNLVEWGLRVDHLTTGSERVIIAPYLADGSAAVLLIGTVDTSAVGGWHHVRLTATQTSASVCDLALYVNGALEDSASLGSAPTPRTIGIPYTVTVGADTVNSTTVLDPDQVDSASIAHLAFFATDDAADAYEAGIGYAGETAADRFDRLCTEEGITGTVVGTAADSQAMGPQPINTLAEVLKECAHTDAGLLYETRDALGLSFRTGRDLYNQDPVLELSFIAKEVAPPFEPTIGDYGTRNDVTASRSGGSSARAVREAGALSVQAPPSGVGRYDTQLDVNPQTDGRLLDHAGWHLHKGTVDETRWRQVAVDLDAQPSLAGDVSAVDVGDRITISNLDPDDSPDMASLIVLGVDEQLGSHRRMVTFRTVPASPYEIGIVGANDGSTDLRGQAVDTDNSTLNSSVTATGTSLSVASTGGVLWTTDSDDWNTSLNGGDGLLIRVGGEDMRVTNITGASSPQTFTVVRSINGVVKAHSAGAAVHVRYPVVVAL